MNEYFVSYEELYLIALIGAGVGALFGLVPLILGRRRGRGRLGLYGFIASIIAGALGALLGLIVAGIFTWLVLRDKKGSAPGAGAGPDDTSDSESD